MCLILKRKQRWRLSLPLINRKQNFIAKTKSKNWNCKTKKCLKEEEKPKTKKKEERLKLKPWCCYIVFSPKAYKSVLSPSP